MASTTSTRETRIEDLAERYGFSAEAAHVLNVAVAQGHGNMASFNHPELGGAGQWMRGGLLMIEDSFNHELKGRLDALCHALGERVEAPLPFAQASQHQSTGADAGPMIAHTMASNSGAWWPDSLGQPDATGQQNDLCYAYFAGPQRLAIRIGDRMNIHDTGDHRITGVSQQQGNSLLNLCFTSQHGPIALASLPVVERYPAKQADRVPEPSRAASAHADSAGIFDAIERLGDLKSKGLLSEDEFAAKKQELLARL
ncbi:SHOCT domain-containing protein [uncultured Salinisphaera sp.]|uniref:SHOCT domain-containing protein n=1 Tax=uncultured Salinisphaera sp. TaxID=359372 RepID=UPI0032B21568